MTAEGQLMEQVPSGRIRGRTLSPNPPHTRTRLDVMAMYFLGLYGCSTFLYMLYSQSLMDEHQKQYHAYKTTNLKLQDRSTHVETSKSDNNKATISLGGISTAFNNIQLADASSRVFETERSALEKSHVEDEDGDDSDSSEYEEGDKKQLNDDFYLKKNLLQNDPAQPKRMANIPQTAGLPEDDDSDSDEDPSAIMGAWTESEVKNQNNIEDNDALMTTTINYKHRDHPTLTAFMERPVANEIWNIKPLPNRTTTSDKLHFYEYPEMNSCQLLPSQWPVNPHLGLCNAIDGICNPDVPMHPVDLDPFLPWIHDLFPSNDGTSLVIVAQNRRRCHTGKGNEVLMEKMEPQVALMQPLAVKRIYISSDEERFRLSTFEEAESDGMETRFLCHFHSTTVQSKNVTTLSRHPLNYEYIQYNKIKNHVRYEMFNKQGKNNAYLWDSQFIFECPIPAQYQASVKSGEHMIQNYTSLFVDIVPIRTPTRHGKIFLPPARHGSHEIPTSMQFNASVHFGTNHILPPINASGRWSNVPVCQTSKKTFHIGTQLPNVELGTSKIDSAKNRVKDLERQEKADSQNISRVNVANTTPNHKIHNLVACTWASASFETRGKSSIVNDGQDRLREWLAFHLMVGFDHIYVYDNTFAFFPDAIKNNTLQYTTDMFPTDKVTHIPWPAQVCNNNWPGNADPGERSSQYAAETSCRLRFGPYTEWMASFDIDEYLVPMGNYTSLQQLTQKADRDGTKILGFRVVRGKLREDRAQ